MDSKEENNENSPTAHCSPLSPVGNTSTPSTNPTATAVGQLSEPTPTRSSITGGHNGNNLYIGSIPAGQQLGTAEISREEILRQIFGDVGELIDDFSCAVESTVLLHGRMYVTNRFLCFYSNLFGLEKKIRIPYSHITLITKENTALVIPNAMAVTTRK
jgi:hypothetical protein